MSSRGSLQCKNCGGQLSFAPGTDALSCPYCGTENVIEDREVAIKERDFEARVAELDGEQDVYEVETVHCDSCGAESTLEENVSSDLCPFCGTPIVKTTETKRLIKPQAVLPFEVEDEEAHKLFREWLQSLWFAPNDLKEYARRNERLAGMYLPYWTYDALADTQYKGQRGEYYYVTQTYTDDEGNERTRRVRKTRWHSASGRVQNRFDDVLVVATDSLPREYIRGLEPWDLEDLRPYADEYLAGFRTESYTLPFDEGLPVAKERMQPAIDDSIEHDIGGDTQRITTKDTEYRDVTFKHVLLPVWISAYRYKDEAYRIMVNARTGEVQGERPWSTIKIALAVTAVLLLALMIFVLRG